MLLDLGLTIFIIVQVAQLDVFACCTDNLTLNSKCAYTDIGGTDNVGVDSNGYCVQKSSGQHCEGNLATCASDLKPAVNMTSLCSHSILNEVANTNWDWLLAILVIKAAGLVFLIVLEFRSLRRSTQKAKDNNDPDRKREPGEEDVEATVGCCQKCKHCSCQCFKSCITNTTVFILKLFFLIFGTAATTLAIWLLLYTGRVTFSSCRAISNKQLQNNCYSVQSSCTFDGGQNYYVVVFGNLNLEGPYIVDLITSVTSTVVWLVRFAVLRYYLNQTKLADV